MSIDTASTAIKIPAKLISPGCFCFFLSRGWNSNSSSTAWFLLNVWSEIILNNSLIFLIKKKKANQMRCTNQQGESVHIHTHTPTHMPSFFKVTSWVTLFSVLVLNSWPLTLCLKRDDNVRHQNSIKIIRNRNLFQLTCMLFLQQWKSFLDIFYFFFLILFYF